MPRVPASLRLALAACALFALVSLEALQPRTRAAVAFVVTNTNDAGAGSLRQAIIDANANPGLDTITFQIGTGPQTITPLSIFPSLTDPVVIDGTTQPGYNGTPIVELDGSKLFEGSGLAIGGGDSIVRGLVINRFYFAGISIGFKGGNVVEGCYIGTDRTGAVARGNGAEGVFISGSNNRVGGTTAAARNVISGNGDYGVNIARGCCSGNESSITGNVIQGNYIGVNAAGDAAIPNQDSGVRITSVNANVPVTDNAVGGTTPGAGNVISGNHGYGVELDGFHVANNTVQGNLIGTDATGSFALGNDFYGVLVTGSNNLVGGSAPGARNVISGNGFAFDSSGQSRGSGVVLGTRPGNVLRGNIIGANAQLTTALPNAMNGVAFGGPNTVIGGAGAGEGNVIAFNGFAGVANNAPASANSTGNIVRGNSIFSNGANTFNATNLGIDFGPFGVNQNDAGDGDAGTNNLQNFPVITSVTPGASSFNIKGTLNSIASITYDLDFYANGACDPSGFGEGARRVGFAQVTTDSGGNASFDLTFNGALAANQVVTATATDPSGNTSEFSQCAPAGSANVGSISFEPAALTVSEAGGVASFLLTRTGGSAGSVTVNYSVRGVTARAGSDFTATSGTLTFADGETTKTFTVPILEDALDETFNETAVVSLSTAGDLDALGPRSTATLTINDNDPAPTVSVGDVSAAEGNAGTTSFEFPVTLSAVSGRDVTLTFETADATASGGGNDYTSVASTVTIPAGQTSGKITILVRGDIDSEPDETFNVNLLSATAAVIDDFQAQGTILNDDATPTISLSVNDVTVTEGNTGTTNAAFTVALSAASASTVKVDVTAVGETAFDDSNGDFQTTNLTLTFAPGETTKTANVPVNGDLIHETDETFRVELRNPSGAFIADGSGVGTILNDDAQPTLSVGDVSVFEGGSGTNFVSFLVTLSAPSALPIQFRYRTIGDSATPGEDFIAVDTPWSVSQFNDFASLTVRINGDTITEGDETFFVEIYDVTGATIADGRGVGTIKNDDTAARPTTLQFDRRARTLSESSNFVPVTVTRSGDASQALTVDYTTRVDNDAAAASDRSDYTPAAGTLRFAAGETTKSFDVLLTDDSHAEPQEFISLVLSNPTGAAAALGEPAVSRINIEENDATPPSVNAIDTTEVFVRQHYHDFLNREPDSAGLSFWKNDIEQCAADQQCREVHRISVSQAFFLSIEFQQTGYRVFRLYRATFPDAPTRPRAMPRMAEFLRDTQEIGRNVVVGATGWEEQLRQNLSDFARRWLARPEVVAQLPETLTAAQFVDKLFANSGITPTAAERDEALAAYSAGGVEGRAAALLSVTGSASVFNKQYNAAFVYMQYAGYLRRHPSDVPDTDFKGFDFWLAKLDSFTLPGEDARDEGTAVRRAQRAEMVKAFLSSLEYRQRFGTP